jgi:hypothetical protein
MKSKRPKGYVLLPDSPFFTLYYPVTPRPSAPVRAGPANQDFVIISFIIIIVVIINVITVIVINVFIIVLICIETKRTGPVWGPVQCAQAGREGFPQSTSQRR